MQRLSKHRVNSRLTPAINRVHPKDKIVNWNIVTGDKVAIISGKDKDTIGEVKEVNRQANTLTVLGKKIAKKHVKPQPSLPEGIYRKEMPIHYSNVMLLHPDTQLPTRIDRRKVEKTLEDGRIVSKWTRFVQGTDIEIPKPRKPYQDRSGEEKFTTSPEDVLSVSYAADFTQPPFPQDIVKELRNVYKKKPVTA